MAEAVEDLRGRVERHIEEGAALVVYGGTAEPADAPNADNDNTGRVGDEERELAFADGLLDASVDWVAIRLAAELA